MRAKPSAWSSRRLRTWISSTSLSSRSRTASSWRSSKGFRSGIPSILRRVAAWKERPRADEDADQKPGRVDRDVDRRGVAAAHEVLVELVRDRVADPEQEGRRLAADRAHEQQPEDRVLGDVCALAQDRVPGAEPGA